MNSRIKRRNQIWIALDGDHAEFETAFYLTDIAKDAMTESKTYSDLRRKMRSNKEKTTYKKVVKTKRSKLVSLTKEEAKARRQNIKESKAKRLETIVHQPYIEKPKTNKELQLLMDTLYRMKCVLQNCTTIAPKSENDRKINIFLNCKEQPAGSDENAHISRYIGNTDPNGKILPKLANSLRVLFPTLLHHVAISKDNKVEMIYSSPDVNPSKIYYFSQGVFDLYNSIQLFKEQMSK